MSNTTRVKKAVSEYEAADDELSAFLEENDSVFQELYRLVDVRNATCEKAKNIVKRYESSCGDFSYSTSRKYSFDIPLLKERLSKDVFSRITKRVVDRKAVDVLLDRGDISQDEIEGAFEVSYTKKCAGPRAWDING